MISQTEQLNENIAKSLKILIECEDDELVQAAHNELPEERKDLLEALDVLGAYYNQRRSSRNNLIPTLEFAFYGPYAEILDNPAISEKYDYYHEEKQIYATKIQDMVNRRWKAFIQPITTEGEMKLAASKQSGDERLRNAGHGGTCFFQFTSQEEDAHGLTLMIRRANDKIRFILIGNYEQIEHIKSLTFHGKSVMMEEGVGTIGIADVISEYFPLFIIDDEGKQIEMNVVLDENGKQIEMNVVLDEDENELQ